MFEIIFFVFVAGIAYLSGQSHIAYKCHENLEFKAITKECKSYDCKTVIKEFDCYEKYKD